MNRENIKIHRLKIRPKKPQELRDLLQRFKVEFEGDEEVFYAATLHEPELLVAGIHWGHIGIVQRHEVFFVSRALKHD